MMVMTSSILGIAKIETILQETTAKEFRDYVMQANGAEEIAEHQYVHSAEHRFHIVPPVQEPAVQAVLKDIASKLLILITLTTLTTLTTTATATTYPTGI